MSVKNFLQEVEKGLKSPAYFLHANNLYLLEETISSVKKTLPEADLDFNFTVFDLDSADSTPSPEEITGVLNTASFLGSRRYVLVKNFQKLPAKDFKRFQGYLSKPSPNAVLIMLYSGDIKKELRESLVGIKTISLDIRERDIVLWVKEKAKQKGLIINDEAADYLIGTAGSDIGILSSEIDKLSLAGKESIDINSIKEIVEGNRDYSVFDLTNALRDKNAEKVFIIYRALSETSEPYNILGAINWQYSRMLMQAEGPDSQKNKYRRAFELLNEADIQIKSSGGPYPMEYLLVRLLQL